MVVLSSVLELLGEALLDSRIVALDEVIVAELDCQRGLAHATGAKESDLALAWRDWLARRSRSGSCSKRRGSGAHRDSTPKRESAGTRETDVPSPDLPIFWGHVVVDSLLSADHSRPLDAIPACDDRLRSRRADWSRVRRGKEQLEQHRATSDLCLNVCTKAACVRYCWCLQLSKGRLCRLLIAN